MADCAVRTQVSVQLTSISFCYIIKNGLEDIMHTAIILGFKSSS